MGWINLPNMALLATIVSTVIAILTFIKYRGEKNENSLFTERYNKITKEFSDLSEASRIVNELPKDNVTTTTVKEFIINSHENSLKFGDRVQVATNDLTYYDLLPEYIDVLINNIKKGVKYDYYIPDNLGIRDQAKQLYKSVIDKVGFDAGSQVINNIKFYRTSISFIYNMSVVNEKNQEKCYWYFAFSPDQDGENLCIVTFRNQQKKAIKSMISKISESSIEEKIRL